MKTIVNIGTNKKNITGVIFDKPFDKITYNDILMVVKEKLGDLRGIDIQGWADTTHVFIHFKHKKL